jgi:hypothetical protein
MQKPCVLIPFRMSFQFSSWNGTRRYRSIPEYRSGVIYFFQIIHKFLYNNDNSGSFVCITITEGLRGTINWGPTCSIAPGPWSRQSIT